MNDRPRFFYIARLEHPYEIITAENLREFFASVGVPTREIVIGPNGAERTELAGCLNGDALAVLGFNWHLDHSCIGDRHFLDVAQAAGLPVIQWLIDHPCSLWPAFTLTNARNSRFMFQSVNGERYFRRFILPQGRSIVVANTGASARTQSGLTRESFLVRDFKCLLPFNLRRIGGTLADAERQLASLPARLRKAVTAAIARSQNDLRNPIEAHFFDNDPPRTLLWRPRLFHQCVRLIEDIVQLRRRIAVLSVARDFPVLIQSDAAGAEYMRGPNAARFEQGVDMVETLARIKRAQSVVSLSAFNDEIHDRTMNALVAGTVPIIEDNPAHRRFFKHGENALLFRYDDDSLRECLELVCSRPERAYEIAAAGQVLRSDPRLRFGGFDQLLPLASAAEPPGRARWRGAWAARPR